MDLSNLNLKMVDLFFKYLNKQQNRFLENDYPSSQQKMVQLVRPDLGVCVGVAKPSLFKTPTRHRYLYKSILDVFGPKTKVSYML